ETTHATVSSFLRDTLKNIKHHTFTHTQKVEGCCRQPKLLPQLAQLSMRQESAEHTHTHTEREREKERESIIEVICMIRAGIVQKNYSVRQCQAQPGVTHTHTQPQFWHG